MYPTRGVLPACCARAASGHAAAALQSAASNSRRPMVTVIRPSRARCVKGTIPRHERAVLPFKEGRMLVASTSVLASTALLLPLALRKRRHRGLARLRIAVRGACDFSWMANADHGKAAGATLLPKPDLPKSVSHKASAVANRLLSRERRMWSPTTLLRLDCEQLSSSSANGATE